MPKQDLATPLNNINPLLKAESNEMIREREAEAAKAEGDQSASTLSSLAAFVKYWYEENQQYREREGIDRMMLENLSQRNSYYRPEKIAEILKQGGPDLFIGLTGVKCRAAESWLHDIWSSDAPRSWGYIPTPLPDLPAVDQEAIVARVMQKFQEQLMTTGQAMAPADVEALAMNYKTEVEKLLEEEAEDRAARMEQVVDDDLKEGNWQEVFDQVITDITTMPCGVMKGPVMRKELKNKWVQNSRGRTKAKAVPTLVKKFFRVSPFDIFPSEGSVSCDEGYLIERMAVRQKDLSALKGLPHYYDEAIDTVLLRHPRQTPMSSMQSTDWERRDLELKGWRHYLGPDQIEVLDFWGSCLGKDLIDQDIMLDPNGKAIDPVESYEMNVMLAENMVIYAWFNEDPLGRRPYHKTGWAVIPGSFWYMSIPELMKDLQSICNGAIRAMVTNLGIASGPQVIINDINRIPPGTKITSMYPWKIWQFVNNLKSQLKAIDFMQPKMYVRELMAVYEMFSRLADDWTGIPAYSYGNERVAGAGRTASGLSMLMSSASRGIKKVIARIDKEIVKRVLNTMYDWEMQYNKDETIKGDVQIQSKGVMAIIIKEQVAAQRMEFLNATAQDPMARQIMGVEGTANLLRETANVLQMDQGEVVPDKEKVRAQVEQQALAAQMMQMQMMQMQGQQGSAGSQQQVPAAGLPNAVAAM